MRILKEILFHLTFVFYVILTLTNRNEYMMGKMKGKNCTHSERDFSYVTYYYENKPPERSYSTYKELREAWKKKNWL